MNRLLKWFVVTFTIKLLGCGGDGSGPTSSVRRLANTFLTWLSILGLSACGGGGGGDGTSTPLALMSAGAFSGTVSNTSPRNYPILIVRPAGDVWIFNMTGSSVLGFGTGRATEFGTQLSTTSFRYFSRQAGVMDAVVAGTFRQNLSLGGTLGYPSLGQTFDFSSTFRAAKTTNTSAMARAWIASGDNGERVDVTINADGKLNATSTNGCQIEGQFGAGESNIPLLSLQVTTNGACRLPNQQLTGIAYLSEDNLGAELWIGVTQSTKSDGLLIYSRLCSNATTGGSPWSCI